ncbi:MAG: alpha-amylase family glycosyl hydrolase, partial [Schleiferiaceae bacterium]|nr:alpha-amylase family glycosyl hydrolase [Schleiferiaceae bacterium]
MNYTLHFCSILFFFLVHLSINAQKIERIDPPFWWVDMENPTLELIVKGTELNDDVSIQADGVELVKSELSENKNYLFISLKITNSAKAQTLKLRSGKKTFKYQLKERSQENKQLMGLSPKDFIYLITPDRFANGNTKNDVIKGMAEDSVNRAEPYARHGGDIAGMHSKIDYLHDLGVTALWINPLLENDQPSASYHGYAITDHYQIDPRFGSNEDYKNFIDDCHKKGIKIIMDVIYNHFGSEHYLIKDLPEQSFINQWPEFTQTNYRATTLHDPYASEKDKLLMTDGWFDKHMPDMNQRNEHLANYLIQNSIWWIEEFGIDAFRIDTYAYPDQGFMSQFAQAIEKEYPQFFMFGETWVHGPQVQSWYAEKSANKNFDSHLQSVTDFQFAFALHKGLNEKHDWAKGINRLYYVLSGDYMYAEPSHLVTFIDNHDIARMYGLYGKDMNKYKMALALLMTSRGIPQMYYGTEILMAATDGHGEIREDFWGGWQEDSLNKFTKEGRSDLENEAFDFIQSLANFRKNSSALTEGKLVQ